MADRKRRWASPVTVGGSHVGVAGQRRSWDANARAWLEYVGTGGGFRELLDPFVERALGAARGRRFLDAGCGEGRLGRALVERGASWVLGLDLSPALIRAAKTAQRALPAARRAALEYRTQDATRLGSSEEKFHGVVSYLSLMHFPHPGQALGAWRSALLPGGRLVAVLPHPFSQAPGSSWQLSVPPVRGTGRETLDAFRAGRYFEATWQEFHFPGPFREKTRNLHMSLAGWSEVFTRSGFVWTQVLEPRPTTSSLRLHPEWEPLRRQPYFLVIRAELRPAAP